jgi:hypothetical protein
MKDEAAMRLRLAAVRQLRTDHVGTLAFIYLEGVMDALEWILGEKDELPMTVHDLEDEMRVTR